jgi:hypothetical protein
VPSTRQVSAELWTLCDGIAMTVEHPQAGSMSGGSKPEKLNASKYFPLRPKNGYSSNAIGMSVSCQTRKCPGSRGTSVFTLKRGHIATATSVQSPQQPLGLPMFVDLGSMEGRRFQVREHGSALAIPQDSGSLVGCR